MRVRLGSDVLLSSGRLKGSRIGVVCNHASLDRDFGHLIGKLAAAEGVTLAAIFGPQHGFRSDVQDNMVETPHGDDPRLRVPIYSLYSETREPTAEMLRGIDALVIDLQDIGARIYTYIYTMANCLRAAARHGVRVIVCDRPNPIGGTNVEGACLQPGWESFVGQFPLPMRHGMTIGELAALFNDAFGIGALVDVVRMEGWSRNMYADGTGLPWVMPSPNIPTLDTAIVYPGTVLFEGTMLSEGRGTTRPFELVGAPWIEAERFAAEMNGLGLPGAYFRPAGFEPTFQKHARQPCGGCQIHVTDRDAYRPYVTTLALLQDIIAEHGDRFAWKQPPYEYVTDRLPIDVLIGDPEVRGALESGAPLAPIEKSWRGEIDAFRRESLPFRLYR